MTAVLTVEQLAESLRRGLHQDMARATMHPVLGHALDQLSGTHPYTLNVFQRRLYEPFERLRQTKPYVPFRDFIAANPEAERLLRNWLGDDQFILATELTGATYFEARARVLAALRGNNPPIAQWMSWGHWGPGQLEMPEFDALPRLLPVDFPVRTEIEGVIRWKYPDVSTGRTRLYQNFGYAELLQRLPSGRPIPLDAGSAELLQALRLPHDPTPRPCFGRPELNLSTLQVTHMLSTGQPPPLRSVIVPPGQPPPPGFRLSEGVSGRTAEDARWELASRLGDPTLVNEDGFARRVQSEQHQTAAARTERPAGGNPDHPVTQLSNAELVAIARNDHYCVQIATRVVEMGHVRGQRSVRMISRVFMALQPVLDVNLVAHLCGLCDPHNLRILTPEGHAAEDFFAAFYGRGRKFNPNTHRLPHLAGVPRPPRAPGPYDPELVDPGSWSTTFDEHEDFPASVNVFFQFSPYQLEPVAQALNRQEVRSVIAALPASESRTVDAYNHLAGSINAALRSYEMDSSLMPQLYLNGVWR